MNYDTFKPSEKVMILLKSNNREDQSLLRGIVKPEMLFGIAGAIYKKWFGFWEQGLTENEFDYWTKYAEDQIGFVPVNMKKIVSELKNEYESHIITDLIPKIADAKARGEEPSGLLAEISKTSSVFQEIDFDFNAELEKVLNERSDVSRGFRTGFDFMNCTKGLKKGHLWVIGGYTSTGKTMFTLQILNTVMKNYDASVMFVSCEMTQTEILDRLIHIEQRGNKNDTSAFDTVGKYNFKATDKLSKISDMEQMMMTRQFDVYVFDFIQNIEGEGKSEYERMTNVIRKLQYLAHKTNTCIIVVSQISNESAKGETSILTFKGSGAIASACDVGIELKRAKDFEDESNKSPFIVAVIKKNRHGKLNKAKLSFNRETGLFTEIITTKYINF